jgi:hypothetical protein
MKPFYNLAKPYSFKTITVSLEAWLKQWNTCFAGANP